MLAQESQRAVSSNGAYADRDGPRTECDAGRIGVVWKIDGQETSEAAQTSGGPSKSAREAFRARLEDPGTDQGGPGSQPAHGGPRRRGQHACPGGATPKQQSRRRALCGEDRRLGWFQGCRRSIPARPIRVDCVGSGPVNCVRSEQPATALLDGSLDCVDERRRLKAGCSHDWLPHMSWENLGQTSDNKPREERGTVNRVLETLSAL